MLKAISIPSSLFLASIGPSLAWYCPPGDTDCINERNSYHYRQHLPPGSCVRLAPLKSPGKV